MIGAVGTGKGAVLRGIALAYIGRSLGDPDLWAFWSKYFGLREIDYVPIFIDLREVATTPPAVDFGLGHARRRGAEADVDNARL